MEAIDLRTIPKDGDGGDEFYSVGIIIEPADNGWIIYWTDESEETKEVYTNKKALINRLEELL